MAVEVLKAMPVHEPVVLGFGIGAPSRRDCLRNKLVHSATVLAGKRDQHLRALRGIRHGIGSELLELGVSQQHNVGVFAHDHAGGGLVGELRIELETEFSEELFGLWQILDRQIDEDIGSHNFRDLSLNVLGFGFMESISSARRYRLGDQL
jgi:hypothetical protein